ncbi:MAG: hypothetical protein IT337_07080 [Thermomicrobiales bacterium]|nr:hypothetical protein [Thermomicrobiales bacterium]
MRTVLTITDLTRMSGRRVCVAGVTSDGACIRPLPQPGDLEEPWLYQGDRAVIRPFAVVEMDVTCRDSRAKPPHTEDRIVARQYRHVDDLDTVERRDLLCGLSDDGAVEEIFGAHVHGDPEREGVWVSAGSGTRSLGTVRAQHVSGVTYGPKENGGNKYRLSFQDKKQDYFDLSVTDLAFRNYLDAKARAGAAPITAAKDLGKTLFGAADVYLRVGLARRWDKYPDRCYLQITGVYSFPDYLDGRCFADLSKRSEWEVPF